MEYQWEPSQRQYQALNLVLSPDDCDVLYGGAKGGGKSYWLCHTALLMCLWIIDKCGIDYVPKYPYPVGFLGRKVAKDFKTTTLATWKKFIPPDYYEIKGDPAIIIVDKKVQIDTGGLDSTEAINKFNSAEYMFIGVDQAEETTKDDVSVLRGSLRGQVNSKHIPYKSLFTANPGQCWLKEDFITTSKPGHYYVPALPTDNPYLPDGYIETLKKAFAHRQELLEAYLNGSWDVFDDACQVIKGSTLLEASKIDRKLSKRVRFISCDPARYGDDETVMLLFENEKIIGAQVYGQLSADRLNNILHTWAKKERATHVIIEENGMGGPIVDWQRKMSGGDYKVIAVDVASKPRNETRFANRRAEMWWNVSENFEKGDLSFHAPCLDEERLQKLKSHLCTPQYGFRGQKIKLESKEDIKKRIGCSPDWGDCAILGWSHLQDISRDRSYFREERKRRRYRPKKRTALGA